MRNPCKCGETDPEKFYRTGIWCRSCQRDAQRQSRLRKIGMTDEQHAAMFAAQDGKCAVCKAEQRLFARALHMDHNHTTGRPRQLLCANCNLLIGRVHEDSARLRALADYIDRWL